MSMYENEQTNLQTEEPAGSNPAPKKRGRPKGSKNKDKAVSADNKVVTRGRHKMVENVEGQTALGAAEETPVTATPEEVAESTPAELDAKNRQSQKINAAMQV